MSEHPAKLSKNQKLAVYGVSASVLALVSYYLYSKFIRGSRSGSSSSDSGDDTALLESIKKRGGVLPSSQSPAKHKQSPQVKSNGNKG